MMRIKSLLVMLLSLASLTMHSVAAEWTAKNGVSTTTYNRMGVAFRLAVLLMHTLWIHPVSASTPPYVSYLEMAQESDFVLVGTMHNIRGNQAQFAVEQVLKGATIAPVVEVTPVTSQSYVLYSMGPPRVQEGETLVLFLKKGAVLTIMVDGWATLTFKPETKNATVEAVKHLLKLPPRSQTDALAPAMLALAVSDYFLLRREAHRYILKLRRRNDSEKYEKEFIELLKRPESDVRVAALEGLEFLRSTEALPLIIEYSRGDDLRLVQAASMALRRYDTAESTAALIALTRRANPNLKVRALIDLDDSRHPEAKAALIALLDDPDPKVRALAPRGLVMWLRRGEAAEVVPKLIKMLFDPVSEVQLGAAAQLGESGSLLAVEPLFDVLRRKDLSNELEKAAMGSLDVIYSRIAAPSRPPVGDNLSLVIAVLERGRWLSALSAVSFLARDSSPQSVAALRHAAQSHPVQDVREYAKRSLPIETTKALDQP